ncbi:MAG: hypothetical protein KGQ42_05845 [Alphaproteobacteria bacterium]|nr:hypothetical protein [Alphaproteobacteria bacterium]MDE2340438.1 hypothetical protein [Alphaproteobacteria bacterium]
MKKTRRKVMSADKPGLLATLLPYAETDVLCYRAETPADLAARQAAAWDPILDWARVRYDISISVFNGIIHTAQPAATVEWLRAVLCRYSAEQLVALHSLITITGSLICALMVAEGALDADAAFAATHLDELYQVEQWGEDEPAIQARAARLAEFVAAANSIAALAAA